MVKTMTCKIHIDQELCIQYGSFKDTCPPVFILENGKKSSIPVSYQTKTLTDDKVPDNLRECVQETVTGSPDEAISIN